MVATSPTVKPETTSSAGLSTPELRSSTTGGGARSTATDRPSDPVPLALPPAAPSASATTAASAAPSASATTPASTVPPASATTSATAAPLSCPPWLPLALWDVMSAKARVTAWTDAVRMASGAAVDADRAAAQLAQDALADEEFHCEVSAREEELKHLRANRASNAQKIQDLEALQQQYDRQRSQLAATLTADRRQEDHLVEAGRQAERRREGELRDRAKRSPCVSGAGGRPASTAPAAPSRTYAAAASCSPVTRSSSSRHGPVAFESGDFGFTPATLADVANSPQFNFLPEDRASVKDLAADMFNALPAAVTIQEAIDVANTSRPDLRDLASRLLAGMRKANARATAPVVYPGCSGPPSAPSGGFQQPAPGRVKKAQPSRSSRESGPGSSGEESGWSSAGASRRPQEPSSSSAGGSRERKVAKRSGDGARGSKTKSGTGSGSDTCLSRKPGRQSR